MLKYRLFFQFNAKPNNANLKVYWVNGLKPKQIETNSNLTCKIISKHNFEDYFTRNQNTSLKLTEKLTELAESYDFDDDYEDDDKSEKYWRSLGKPGQR